MPGPMLQDHFASLASIVSRNLEDQHDWTNIEVQQLLNIRPLIRGLPSRRLYVHSDDQVAALRRERETGERSHQTPEPEWVLPTHLAERWTINNFAAVFDSIPTMARGKRLVLATVHADSTVVYYLMHEGMVKPRQN